MLLSLAYPSLLRLFGGHRERLAPVNVNRVDGSAHGVEMALAWTDDDLVAVALCAWHAVVQVRVPILVVRACGAG